MTEREPFNPTDPMDAMAEMFRRQVTEAALAAYKVTIYRNLSPQQQLQCFLAGAMTGVIGVALASVDTSGADAMMEAIANALPDCREMAESICEKNHHDAAAGGSSQ